MTTIDRPFQRRPIDFTGWDLVFTRKGKYFFYDTVEKFSQWRPPENLLEYLLDLPAERLALLFDPYSAFQPEVAEDNTDDGSVEGDYLVEKSPEEEGDDSEGTVSPKQSTKEKFAWESKEEHAAAIVNFKELLQEAEIDPFMAWSSISEKLASDDRFKAVPTDKERKTIFDEICPELAERSRNRRKVLLEAAHESWNSTLASLTLATAPSTWIEFSKSIKKKPWSKLLDAKRMEKDYRARLDLLHTRSIVYQIPK